MLDYLAWSLAVASVQEVSAAVVGCLALQAAVAVGFPSSEKAAISAQGAWGPGLLSSCANLGTSPHFTTVFHGNIVLLCGMRGWT